ASRLRHFVAEGKRRSGPVLRGRTGLRSHVRRLPRRLRELARSSRREARSRMIDASLERLVGSRVVDSRRVAGGDVNEAYSVKLADGRRVFVKTNASAPKGLFTAEAKGLGLLRET